MCLNVGLMLQGLILSRGQSPRWPWHTIRLLADMDEFMHQQRQSLAGLGLQSTRRKEDVPASREGVRP
jgi:hypothetical protein